MPSQLDGKHGSLPDTMPPAGHMDIPRVCAAALELASCVFEATSAWILLRQVDTDELVTVASRGPEAGVYAHARIACDRGLAGFVLHHRRAIFVPDVRDEDRWYDTERVHRSSLRSVVLVPLMSSEAAPIGVLGFASPRFTPDTPPETAELARVQAVAAMAAADLRHVQMIEALQSDRLRLVRQVGEPHARGVESPPLTESNPADHSDLVGDSPAMRDVATLIELVAPADTTVLLAGETGTGKELVAHAIHARSRRSRRPFVAVNCAALPEALVESELFGYEKGAFTGASTRKPGKFELADSGTMFLDEIGDLPAQAQAKLLRVLQEREVQRVGGTRSEPINVRLIAATNQDLGASIQSGRFRSDLFYRLSVFPIRLPPLRERRQDIPLLAGHFARRITERQGKPVPVVNDEALQMLTAYDWPGNVRELQNVIERAVVLSAGGPIAPDTIRLYGPLETAAPLVNRLARAGAPMVENLPIGRIVRFTDAERAAILSAVERAGWRISGRGGAAELLGLKPTTLHAKMRKLGIRRPTAASHNGHLLASGSTESFSGP